MISWCFCLLLVDLGDPPNANAHRSGLVSSSIEGHEEKHMVQENDWKTPGPTKYKSNRPGKPQRPFFGFIHSDLHQAFHLEPAVLHIFRLWLCMLSGGVDGIGQPTYALK